MAEQQQQQWTEETARLQSVGSQSETTEVTRARDDYKKYNWHMNSSLTEVILYLVPNAQIYFLPWALVSILVH